MLVSFTDPIRLNSLPDSLSRFSTLVHVSRLTQAGAPALGGGTLLEGTSAVLLPPAHFSSFGVQLGFEPGTLCFSAWSPPADRALPQTSDEFFLFPK